MVRYFYVGLSDPWIGGIFAMKRSIKLSEFSVHVCVISLIVSGQTLLDIVLSVEVEKVRYS